MLKFIAEVYLPDDVACDLIGETPIECVRASIRTGLMDHFEFYRPELSPEEIYRYMKSLGYCVGTIKEVE